MADEKELQSNDLETSLFREVLLYEKLDINSNVHELPLSLWLGMLLIY